MSYDYADSALDERVIALLRAENERLRTALKKILDASNDPYEIARAALTSQDRAGGV